VDLQAADAIATIAPDALSDHLAQRSGKAVTTIVVPSAFFACDDVAVA